MIQILRYTFLTLFLFFQSYGWAFLFGIGEDSNKFKIPELTGPIVDQAQVIDAGTASKLQKLLFLAERQSEVQLQILTLKSLQGLPIEQASIQIVDAWKLGKEKTDKGVLLLVVPSERKARIEVGQGLEGEIPDAIAKRILADVARPYFKDENYAQGIYLASLEILKYAGVAGIQSSNNYQQNPRRNLSPEAALIAFLIDKLGFGVFIVLFVLLFFLRMLSPFRFHRRGPWDGLGGGGGRGGFGGGWSGGGGGFSGGGSSDSW